MREKWTHRVRESGRVAAGPFAVVACDDDGDDVIRPGRAGRDPPSPLVARRRLPPAARRCLCHCAIMHAATEPRVQEAALRGVALPRRRRGGRGFDSRGRRGSLASWPGALTGGVPAADGGGDRRRVRAPEAGEGGDRVSLDLLAPDDPFTLVFSHHAHPIARVSERPPPVFLSPRSDRPSRRRRTRESVGDEVSGCAGGGARSCCVLSRSAHLSSRRCARRVLDGRASKTSSACG